MDKRELRGQDGFSIIEVLVAIVLLVVGILGALAMIDTANGTTLANRARTVGVNLAREVSEGSRAVQESVPYSQLSSGCPTPSSPSNPCASSSPIVTGLQAQPGLASDPASPAGEWTIVREQITYDVKVSVCAMDDPSDGVGNHLEDGPFCADAGASGTTDTAPDDYQRLIVDVTWSGTRGSEEARTVTLLRSDGVNGPAVCLKRTSSATCPESTTPPPPTASVPFTATLSGPASRVVWYVDGAFKGTVTPNGSTANFTWQLGTVGSGTEVFDGSYEISAAAFDVNGKSGTTGSVQVQVNRRSPVAPGGFLAGRDTAIGGNGMIGGVDLEWLPVPDQDILYYRVYRKVGAAAPTLLTTTADTGETSYTDRTPPANPTVWTAPCSNPRQAAASPLTYWVVAVDQNGASVREGAATPTVEVNACNTAPKNPPTSTLQLVDNPSGTVTLSGNLPAAPTDNDAGDRVNAVRVYRWAGSSLPSDPADRLEYLPVAAAATGFTFTDPAPRPAGVDQKYCFTNVDLRMQESNCSNVVTG